MLPDAGDAARELADGSGVPLAVWLGCGASTPAGSTGGSAELLLPPPVPLQFT